MWATARILGASLQIALAAGYVAWVAAPGSAHTRAGLASWALALSAVASATEVAWYRGHRGDLSSVARVAGLLTLGVALGLLAVTVVVEAMLPTPDF